MPKDLKFNLFPKKKSGSGLGHPTIYTSQIFESFRRLRCVLNFFHPQKKNGAVSKQHHIRSLFIAKPKRRRPALLHTSYFILLLWWDCKLCFVRSLGFHNVHFSPPTLTCCQPGLVFIFYIFNAVQLFDNMSLSEYAQHLSNMCVCFLFVSMF